MRSMNRPASMAAQALQVPQGGGCHAGFAVETTRQNSGDCRFTNAPGASKQVRVMEPISVERVRQGFADVILSNQVGKPSGSPLSCQNLLTHKFLIGNGSNPCQPHPGTPDCRCRCSLPGLTGFTTIVLRGDRQGSPLRPIRPKRIIVLGTTGQMQA